MILVIPSALIQQEQPSGASIATEWGNAIKTGDWAKVYLIGSRFLDHPRPFKNDNAQWDRMIGFTWFAAYREAVQGRIQRDPLVCVQEAMKRIPDQHEVWYELGVQLNRRGKHQEALASLNEYIKRVPRSFDGRFEKAYALTESGQLALGLRELQSLDVDYPNLPRILREIAFIHNERGENSEALAVLLKAKNVEPKDPLTHAELAYTLRRLKRWTEALEELDLAASLGFDREKIAQERTIIEKQKVP